MSEPIIIKLTDLSLLFSYICVLSRNSELKFVEFFKSCTAIIYRFYLTGSFDFFGSLLFLVFLLVISELAYLYNFQLAYFEL